MAASLGLWGLAGCGTAGLGVSIISYGEPPLDLSRLGERAPAPCVILISALIHCIPETTHQPVSSWGLRRCQHAGRDREGVRCASGERISYWSGLCGASRAEPTEVQEADLGSKEERRLEQSEQSKRSSGKGHELPVIEHAHATAGCLWSKTLWGISRTRWVELSRSKSCRRRSQVLGKTGTREGDLDLAGGAPHRGPHEGTA